MAHLSFGELLERRVPLSSGEAVALTLAAASAADAQGSPTQRVALPDIDQILLSSTGRVSLMATHASREDDADALSSVLTRLLGISERTDANGRIPGGLLILLARARRQIDLPPLTSGALREALLRFASSSEPQALAAVFWRAARMRARTTERGLVGSRSRGRAERRTNGPSKSELRHWLRQAEREVFDLQRGVPARVAQAARLALHQFKSAAGTVALLTLVCGAIALGFGMYVGGGPNPRRPVQPAGQDVQLRGPSGPPITEASFASPSTAARQHQLGGRRSHKTGLNESSSPASAKPRAKRLPSPRQASPPARAVTVRMVNLPRASWSVNR